MSFEYMAAVNRLYLKMEPKAVLLQLADQTNNDGENISVAIKTLALYIGCSERMLQEYLRKFEYDQVLIETPGKTGRGRCKVWKLDIERARQLYGRVPTFNQRRKMEEKGESPAPFAKPGKGAGDSEKGAGDSEKGAADAPTPIKTPSKDPGGAPDASADGADTTDPPEKQTNRRPRPAFYRVWSDKAAAIIDQVGEQVWRSWLKDLRPWPPHWAQRHAGEGYEPDALYLGAPSRFFCQHVAENYLADLETIIGKPLRLLVAPAGPSARDYWHHIEEMAEREERDNAA